MVLIGIVRGIITVYSQKMVSNRSFPDHHNVFHVDSIYIIVHKLMRN